MFSNKWLVAAILLAAFAFLPSACGFTLSVSGDAGGYAENAGAGANDGLKALTTIADTGISNSITGMGSLNETHSVSNNDGASASVGVDIRKAADYSYSYNLIPGEGTGWNAPSVQASESLDVRDADYVKAYALASRGSSVQNSKVKIQDKIGVSTEVTKGSLLGYSNQAAASSGDLSASQSFESASGETIQATTGPYVQPKSSSSNSNGRGQSSSVAAEPEVSVATTASGRLTDFDGSVRKSSGLFEAEQSSHVEGTFSSTAKSGSASVTRTSNYGQEYDLSMRAVKDASGPYATGTLGYYVNIMNSGANKIQGAVDAAQAGDSINVAQGTYKENVLIDKSLIVNGAGADQTIVDGDQNGSVFTIGTVFTVHQGDLNPGVSVTLSNITIKNGTGTSAEIYGSGNGFEVVGGGILNAAEINLNDDIISSNAAVLGAGIFNSGILNLNDGSIIYNTAAVGAGICNAGTMTMNGGSVDHNIATMGSAGGIYNFVGTMNLKGVSISNNIASVYGGGIYNWGTMTADECAIDHNTANIGGGIYNSGGDDISNVTMNGGSISYNDATGVGGGIYNIVGSAFLNGVSIDHNTAIYGGGILNTQSNVSMNCGSIDHNIAKGYYDSNYPYEYYPGLGGGIASFLGNVCLDGVSLDHNIAYYGGGIYHLGGEANLNDATISSNSAGHYDQNSNWVADGYGGGIWNGVLDNPSYGGLKFIGTVNLNSSSISYNDAGVGGGIYNDQSIVNLISGSIDHNMAQSHGGGIYNGGSVTGNAALVHDNIPDDIYP